MTDQNIVDIMASGKPYKSFIKTIFGKVRVITLDEFDTTGRTIREVLLKGSPKKKDEDCIIDLWTERQYLAFKRYNAIHIQKGNIIEYTRPVEAIEEKHERTIAEWSDEELLTNVLKTHFQTFQKVLNSIDLVSVLYRLLSVAQENELSGKLIERVKARISEVQGTPYEEIVEED